MTFVTFELDVPAVTFDAFVRFIEDGEQAGRIVEVMVCVDDEVSPS